MGLDNLNSATPEERREMFRQCCGASRWIEAMVAPEKWQSASDLFRAAEIAADLLTEDDWLEAFTHHPKIGDLASLRKKYASTEHLTRTEQGGVASADEDTLIALSLGNDLYEQRNGFIFIVCATGKSATEMLGVLESRLGNNRAEEIRNAAIEQRKITRLRLEKLLA